MSEGFVILNSIIIAALLKNFVISQVVKVALGQPADVGLASANDTAWAIAAGALGCLTASLMLKGLQSRHSRATRSHTASPWSNIQEANLELVGYTLAAAGLLARIAASALPDAPVVLFYAGNLAYAGVAALVLRNYRKSEGKSIFDKTSISITIIFAALSVMKGSKDLVIAPFVFITLLYIYFGRRPTFSVIGLGLCAFLFTALVFYPMVNYARTVSPTDAKTGLAMAMQTVSSPGGWTTLNERSDGLEAKWANRLYYGRPMGMINRFTPNQVADVVNVASYASLDAKPQIRAAIGQLLPQTFGFDRDNTSATSAIESVVKREYNKGENNANYGLIANFYLFGGAAPTFVGMFCIAMLIGLVEAAWFSGGRYAFWALPLVPGLLFSVADKNIASFLVNFIHGTTITIGLTILLSLPFVYFSKKVSRPVKRAPSFNRPLKDTRESVS